MTRDIEHLMKAKHLVELDSIDATDPSRAGAKAAGLARWSRAGFRVPGGLVVCTRAYRDHVAEDPRHARRLAGLPGADRDEARRLAGEIRAGILRRGLDPRLESQLRERLPALLQEGPVAVRASATREGPRGAGRAGLYHSVLNLVEIDETLHAIQQCWASLWSDAAVADRAARGCEARAVEMAVLVQRLLPGEVSGRASSLHPVSGRLDRVRIEARWGLGGAREAEDGEGDRFEVDAETGRILDRQLGLKRRARIAATRGVMHRELDTERAQALCLDDTRTRLVARLCSDLAARAGFPQDIEWSFHGGELQLLQARPITRLPERWTREATAERFPEPSTRLSWDIIGEGFHASMAWSLDWMGLPPLDGRWFERKDGYIYSNRVAEQVFRQAIALPFESLDALRERLPEIQQRYAWVHALPTLWMRDSDRHLMRLGRLSQIDPDALDERALLEQIEAIRELGRTWFRPKLALALAHDMLRQLLAELCDAAAGPERGPRLYADLVCGLETRSAQVEAERFELYTLASRDPQLAALIRSTDRRALWASGRLRAFPSFHARMTRFIEEHGHRERVFDLYHPTLSEAPWALLQALRRMLSQAAAGQRPMPPERRARLLRVRQGQADARFSSLLPVDLRFFASEVLRLTRLYGSLADLEHYQTARLAPPLRRALLSMGARLAARGALARADDLFFLDWRSAEAGLLGRVEPATLRQASTEGRARHARRRQQIPVHEWPASGAEHAALPAQSPSFGSTAREA